jgi:hypothetical protein
MSNFHEGFWASADGHRFLALQLDNMYKEKQVIPNLKHLQMSSCHPPLFEVLPLFLQLQSKLRLQIDLPLGCSDHPLQLIEINRLRKIFKQY